MKNSFLTTYSCRASLNQNRRQRECIFITLERTAKSHGSAFVIPPYVRSSDYANCHVQLASTGAETRRHLKYFGERPLRSLSLVRFSRTCTAEHDCSLKRQRTFGQFCIDEWELIARFLKCHWPEHRRVIKLGGIEGAGARAE